MDILMVGLGKMGLMLAKNLKDHGYKAVGFDKSEEMREKSEQEGVKTFSTLDEAVASLSSPKVVWSMVPSGAITESVLAELFDLLGKGDILIEGGNSNYKDTVRRAEEARKRGIVMMDVGTSGGVGGARNGACLMIGGDKAAFDHLEPLLKSLSTENGYLYTGPSGSGHFLKMVHNGIEYGMMQAIGEGFEVLEKGPYDYDFEKVSRVWNHGSVIRSWLIELCESAFSKDAKLDSVRGVVQSSGEAEWTMETAMEYRVSIPVIAASLLSRYRSLESDNFGSKVVASLRNEFGGHAVTKK